MSTELEGVSGGGMRYYESSVTDIARKSAVIRNESASFERGVNNKWRDGAHLYFEAIGTLDESPGIRTRGERLEIFPTRKVAKIVNAVGGDDAPVWPMFDGYLVMLFVARSGSSFLSTELEKYYDIGKMSEHLNSSENIKKGITQKISQKRLAGQWFTFKAGIQGVVNAEASGLMDSALGRMHFLRLVRRDIIGQAISTVKARQTQQWHMNTEAVGEPNYSLAELEKAVAMIASGVEILRVYAARTGRPCRQVVYEDISNGSLGPALMACDEIGVPRRTGEILKQRSVERMSRDSTEDWNERFRREMGAETRNWILKYDEMLAT